MSSPYRLGGRCMFERPNEGTQRPKRVFFLSVEGTTTEVQYFHCIERYKRELEINAIVHIEVLRRFDTRSDPDNVLKLLEEYIDFRDNNEFENVISKLNLKSYDKNFIQMYLENPNSIKRRERNEFENVLKQEHIDLVYLDFLSKYRGENDVFGIVIDRDCNSHSAEQLNNVINKCNANNYYWFLTNPCLEFWLLLHVSDVAEEYKECLDDILANRLDEHGNSYVSNLLYNKTKQRKAIQNKTFEQYYLYNLDLAIDRAKTFALDSNLLDKLGSNMWKLFELLRN